MNWLLKSPFVYQVAPCEFEPHKHKLFSTTPIRTSAGEWARLRTVMKSIMIILLNVIYFSCLLQKCNLEEFKVL